MGFRCVYFWRFMIMKICYGDLCYGLKKCLVLKIISIVICFWIIYIVLVFIMVKIYWVLCNVFNYGYKYINKVVKLFIWIKK